MLVVLGLAQSLSLVVIIPLAHYCCCELCVCTTQTSELWSPGLHMTLPRRDRRWFEEMWRVLISVFPEEIVRMLSFVPIDSPPRSR